MKKIFGILFLLLSTPAFAQQPGFIPDKYGQSYADDAPLRFGTELDAWLEFDAGQTNDALFLGLNSSNYFLVGEKADMGFNFAHPVQTDPTLFVHSRNQNANQWISISHNGTNGVISVGTGSVTFPGGVSAPISGSDAISTTNTNAAGGSANPFDITSALGIMNGSDDYTAIDINITNANHTGASNVVKGVDISAITGDAEATETAILIGNGWDVGVNAGNNSITTTGAISGGSFAATGNITSTAATNIGWSVVAGANTACNTTCTNACVFGQNTGDMAIVDCANATADVCVCAGAN